MIVKTRWSFSDPSRPARAGAALALFAPVVLFCAPFLFSSQCLDATDWENGFRPQMVVCQQGWKHDGELPRWNPYFYAGAPVLGSGQGTLYYPPMWLFLRLSAEAAYKLFIVLHLLLAAFGMYRLARSLSASRPGSVLAGIAYSLSYASTTRIDAGHLFNLITHCQAPLLLYLVVTVLRKPSKAHTVMLGAWGAVVLVSGFPQWIYLLGLLCFALVTWWTLRAARRREEYWKPLFCAAAAGVFALALASGVLLPVLEVARLSARNIPVNGNPVPVSWYAVSGGDLIGFFQPSFPWTASADQWMRGRYDHEKALYIGFLPLGLCALALAGRPRGPVLFFTVAAGAALLASLAEQFPSFYNAVRLAPWFSKFRIPARTAWIAVLALPVVAAFGWDAAAERLGVLRRRGMVAAMTALVGASGALFIMGMFGAVPELWLYGSIVGLAVLLAHLAPRGVLVAAAAALLTTADLDLRGFQRLRIGPRERFERQAWYAPYIGEERANFRVLDLTNFDLPPMAQGFRLLKGYGYPMLQSLTEIYAEAWKGRAGPIYESLSETGALGNIEYLRRLNVRWIVAGIPLTHPDLVEVARSGSRILYEDSKALPYVVLEDAAGQATWSRPKVHEIAIAVRADRPGRVIVSESWMPGWKARRDGRPAEVSQEYGALLGVDVPAGECRIELVYAPGRWKVGGVLSGVALLIGLVVLWSSRTSDRTPTPPPPGDVSGVEPRLP